MRVTTAQLPGPEQSDDRIFTARGLVIMLDGASAFISTEVSAAAYVDALGAALFKNITRDPEVSLVDALSSAIEKTAKDLDLVPGTGPSSAVAIARTRSEAVDILVLGDTQIVTPDRLIRDDRVACIGSAHRAAYQARLRDGHGYDAQHRAILGELQEEQRRHRNREGGYWIAEASPQAATHAVVEHFDLPSTPWLVLATDGAYRPVGHLGKDDWARIAGLDRADLADLLSRCHLWEAKVDPKGINMPRAKRHDDKSVAVVRPND